jgi:hypothetical protein
MVMATLTAFALALAFGGPAIRWLARHKVGEDVTKTDSPGVAAHAEKVKRDTPMMEELPSGRCSSRALWCRLDSVQVVLGWS